MAVQKQVPVSEGITAVEFSLTDLSYPFVGASIEGGQVMLEEIIPRGDGIYGEFYSIKGQDPETVLELAAEHESAEPKLLAEFDEGALFEFVVSDSCPAVFLGEEGALPRRVESIDAEGHIAAEIPASVSEATVIQRFLDAHPDAELVAKRQQPYSTQLFSHREFSQVVDEVLTERQREVLAVAHEMGYYEWPRDVSGEELADELGISAPTFHEHLRTAEQELITILLEKPSC